MGLDSMYLKTRWYISIIKVAYVITFNVFVFLPDYYFWSEQAIKLKIML